MQGIVIFGVGSPVVVDVEESLARCGVAVAAAVRNVPGEVHLLDPSSLMELTDVTTQIKARPFLVPLFTPAHRQKAARQAQELGFGQAFSLIDASVAQPRSLKHGPGLYINAGCSLGAASDFDEFIFINRGANLGHHLRLGRFVSIGPGAVVAGLVKVGQGAMIGAGAVVLPKVTIGANAVIGAGSVVTKDVPDHCLVMGNPARVVDRAIPGYANQSVT